MPTSTASVLAVLVSAASMLAVSTWTAAPALARPAPVGVWPQAAAAPARAHPAAGSDPPPASRPAARWQWPLTPAPPVVRPFRAPPTPWSPGHRGVDLRAGVDQPVLAAGDGIVAFAGSVAGRGVVTVGHGGGLRTTYEPVATAVKAGQPVVRGQRIGVLTSEPGHCAPAGCLHWGLRRGTDYLDPLQLLRPAEPPVLKPLWD